MYHTHKKLNLRSALIAGAATATALCATSGAMAQQATETVVVTGSRIPVSDLTQAAPVSVQTSENIQMTKAFSLEDVLQKMIGPDVVGGISLATNNGGNGLSNVGLRTLGPQRTLVLIDGQRLIPEFTGSITAPDLNSVPLAMIDRVEVLRDGASSIYGADAIGGVINIITKKDFSGLAINATAGTSQHGGDDTYGLDATLGINIPRGNVTINVLHDFESAVGGWQRDWATNPHQNDPNFPGGSSYRTQLPVLQDASNAKTVWLGGVAHLRSEQNLSIPCTTFITQLNRWKLNANCDTPYGGWNTLQGSLARTQFSLNGHYDITDDLHFILQGSYTDRRSGQQLRSEPLLGGAIGTTEFPGFYVPADPHWGFTGAGNLSQASWSTCPAGTTTVNCFQTYLTPEQFGPRTYRQTSETYRFRVGLEGKVFGDYNWEAGYVQQRNEDTNRVLNSGNFYHLAEETGLTPCVDVPGGCTAGPAYGFQWSVPVNPINFYNGPDNLTKSDVAFLTYPQVDVNRSVENYIYFDVNGPVFELPAGMMKGSVGFERRYEYASDIPDSLVQAGYGPNQALPTGGSYGTYSVYGELYVPLLKDLPFAEMVDLTPSARYDHYSNFGDATTWKIGANWTVNDDLRFRGTYSTNFRAPNVAELYQGNSISYNGVAGDPCDSRTVINGNKNMATSAADAAARLASGTTCYNSLLAAGVPAGSIASYQSPENALSSDQRALLLGGNPNLQPEKAHQWTAGAVLTPQFIPGLSVGGDYYEVTITNVILSGGGIPGSIGANAFVDGCYVGQNASFCKAITRNTAVGILQIDSRNTNFGVAKVSGLDLEANYQNEWDSLGIPLPGAFSWNIQAAHQFSNNQTNPDGTVSNFLGSFQNESAENVVPKWRGTTSLDWMMDQFTFHYDLQWIGSTTDFNVGDDNNIPDYFYHNVSVAYDMGSTFGGAVTGTKFIFGVNNLLDKDPPFLAQDSICKCNSVAGPFDFVGRFFYARISLKM